MNWLQSQPIRVLARACASLMIAAAAWLPLVHLLFRPDVDEFREERAVAPQARKLAERQLSLWENPADRAREVSRMRRVNAEWDFMGRTFLVLSLANLAIDEPGQMPRCLAVIDAIIEETLRLESAHGMHFFLLDDAQRRPFKAQPARSIFVDGEMAWMLAARQIVKPDPDLAPLLTHRIDLLAQSMAQAPVLCAESYPDECWLFCNSVAVAAIAMSDRIDQRDHSPLIDQWLSAVKTRLINPATGLLISSFSYDGRPINGPEGSSIWMAAHCIEFVDPAFAAEQYRLAKRHLGGTMLGLGYAREWPSSWPGEADIDSGPVIPVLGISAGSSGLALLGAASFGDDEFLQQLLTTLEFAAFPVREDNRLWYAAGNQVGDAVLLYALLEGAVRERTIHARNPER